MVLLEGLKQITHSFIYGNLNDESSGDEKKQKLAHQKNIVKAMIFSVSSVPIYLLLGYHYLPIYQPPLPTLAHRLTYTIKWQIPSIMFLFYAIFSTSLRRFTTKAYNPIEGGEQDKIQVYKNILTNSVEAYIINGGAQLILTTFLNEHQMKIIPLLVSVFILSRVLFWRGYTDDSKGRGNRAYGFGLSTFTALVVMLYCVYRFLLEMISGEH